MRLVGAGNCSWLGPMHVYCMSQARAWRARRGCSVALRLPLLPCMETSGLTAPLTCLNTLLPLFLSPPAAQHQARGRPHGDGRRRDAPDARAQRAARARRAARRRRHAQRPRRAHGGRARCAWVDWGGGWAGGRAGCGRCQPRSRASAGWSPRRCSPRRFGCITAGPCPPVLAHADPLRPPPLQNAPNRPQAPTSTALAPWR